MLAVLLKFITCSRFRLPASPDHTIRQLT